MLMATPADDLLAPVGDAVAKPWTSAKRHRRHAVSPRPGPAQTEPVSDAAAAAAKAEASSLPSSPMSMTPERVPRSGQPWRRKISGVRRAASVAVEHAQEHVDPCRHARAISRRPKSRDQPRRRTSAPARPLNRMISPWITKHDLARDGLELEVELRAALRRAPRTSSAREEDADRVVPPHQRHRNPGEPVARGEVQDQLVLRRRSAHSMPCTRRARRITPAR